MPDEKVIVLSTLVGDTKARRSISYSTATPKKTKIAVPEHLKFYDYPQDINRFICDLYPNMVAFVGAKIPRKDMDARQHQNTVDDTVNNFVVYILGNPPSRDDVDARWRLYDPVKWSKQPYYKWFLMQLDFFRKSMQRDMFRESQMMTLSETSFEETAEKRANNAVNLDTVDTGEVQFDVLQDIAIREISDFLEAVSSNYAHHTQCFEKNAFMLFKYRMADMTTADIAGRFGISTSAVNLWSTKLRDLVGRFQADGWGALNPA